MTVRSELRARVAERLIPALRALGFDGPAQISGNALVHEFRRSSERGADVIVLQFEKHGRPRFLLLLHVEPPEGLAAIMVRGGTLVVGSAKPGRGASSRHWFRADPTFWQRLRGDARAREREAVEAAITLLPEIESWWDEQRPSRHITTWPVKYAAQRGTGAVPDRGP